MAEEGGGDDGVGGRDAPKAADVVVVGEGGYDAGTASASSS